MPKGQPNKSRNGRVAPTGGRAGTPKRPRTTMDGGMEARSGSTRRQAPLSGTSGRMDRRRTI